MVSRPRPTKSYLPGCLWICLALPAPGALDEILSTSAGSIPCASTGAVVTVEFNAMVTAASSAGGSVPASVEGGTVVVFEVPSLEATPTSFEVMLDTCGEIEGTPIVGSVTYVDDEDNTPDLASIEGAGIVPICDGESFVPSTCTGRVVWDIFCTEYYRPV